MKLKKRAMESMLGILGSMVLVGLVILILGPWFVGKVKGADIALNPIEMSSRNNLCCASGNELFKTGTLKETIELEKGDGCPDDCDNCLGGDNKKISNSYGISDDCYLPPTKDNKIKTYKDMCKARGGCYISDKDQCCIGDARSKCGSECK